jgi:chemotaxis protein methyltransferase CheR
MWRPDPSAPALSEEEFRLLRDLVREHCGLSFRDEQRALMERRLAPRLAVHGLRDFSAYHRLLRHGRDREAELEEAVDLLTINETYFFREPLQLGALAREILPALARDRARERRLRLLSAGCSTGEEVYTVAILAKESGLFEGWDVEVIGVDVSRRCVAQARAGAYGEHAFRAVEAEPARRWCRLVQGKWLVDDAIRRMVRFGHENLLSPRALAEVPRLDAVLCRNVMIYFDREERRRVLRRLHERLRPGGWLLLGHSESLFDVTADFELVHLGHDLVYRRPLAAGEAP